MTAIAAREKIRLFAGEVGSPQCLFQKNAHRRRGRSRRLRALPEPRLALRFLIAGDDSFFGLHASVRLDFRLLSRTHPDPVPSCKRSECICCRPFILNSVHDTSQTAETLLPQRAVVSDRPYGACRCRNRKSSPVGSSRQKPRSPQLRHPPCRPSALESGGTRKRPPSRLDGL